MTVGLLDTSVVIDWHDPDVVAALPDRMAISAINVAELSVGPLLAAMPSEGAKRQARLQEVESKLEPLAFDGVAARSFGLVVAAVVRDGRRPRSRLADLLIAATAHAHGLDLYISLPDGGGHKAIDTLIGSYAYQHVSVLRPDIRRDVQVIDGWQPQPLTLTMRVPENAGE